MYLAKRVLLITAKVDFSINAKKALERDNKYIVTAFASAIGAVDFIRRSPQHVVIVDFRVKDMPGKDVIDHVRAIQPDIAVIAAPDVPFVQKMKDRYNIQALINIPMPTRQLLLVIHSALQEMYDSQPDTSSSDPVTPWDAPAKPTSENAIEFWVSDEDDGSTVFEMPEDAAPEESTRLFQQLAAEEPPMPDFEDNSTVGDLRAQLMQPELRRIVIEDTTPTEGSEPVDFDDSDEIPAALILEAALDESTPIEVFSMVEFMKRVQERGFEGAAIIKPLPSWMEESQRYIREPDFLPEDLPGFSQPLEYTASVTAPNQPDMVIDDASDLVTDPIEPIKRSFASDKPIPAADDKDLVQWDEWQDEQESPVEPPVAEEFKAIPEQAEEPEPVEESEEIPVIDEVPVALPVPPLPPEMPPTRVEEPSDDDMDALKPPEILEKPTPQPIRDLPFTAHEADPHIAQLAVTLTQVSLELTAEATLLARDGRIVAYAGQLPKEDVDDLREQIADDWDADSKKARIRFITLASSGKDYMIYSRRTAGDFTLSMFFAGTMPLNVIRRQGQRLSEALVTVPEDVPLLMDDDAPAIPLYTFPVPAVVDTLSSFSYVWLLRDSGASLDNGIAQALIKNLDVVLARAGWDIHELDVHEDFIYLHADMPDSLTPREVIKDLMRVSARVVHAEQDTVDIATLWDDSYLIVQPGRSLETAEIQQFINFVRD